MAPPKRGPMVRRPLTRQDTRSLPARAVTMELWAPETAGPLRLWEVFIASGSVGSCKVGRPKTAGPLWWRGGA